MEYQVGVIIETFPADIVTAFHCSSTNNYLENSGWSA